jgi:hypothetical protein
MAILNFNVSGNGRSHLAEARARRSPNLGVLMVFLIGLGTAFAQPTRPSEDQVKAAFLLNFPKYVEWPAEIFAATNSPITLATLGDTSLGEELREMVKDRIVNGRPLVFTVLTENAVHDCHILFVPEAAQRRLPAILEKLKGASVLTVGESDDFLDTGGAVSLVRRERRIRMEVNLAAAKQARLKISSKLLSVADVVKGKPR